MRKELCCEQYYGNITGELFSDFVREHFPVMFEKSANPKGKLFLQDGDPRQNSKKEKIALDAVDCRQFSIPARSPDANPIENFFKVIRIKLAENAIQLNIIQEDFTTFSSRVKNTICSYPTEYINKTIKSMNTQMKLIVARKG